MSGEIIAILSVGIGLGLLSTGLFAWLRLRADFKQLADRVGRLEYIRVFCRIQRTDAASGEKCGRALPRGPSLPRGLWSGG
jgi:hypothetical protein